ncbi:MAG: AbrB/MazE/SpoVT family DNA-binding domain-containing protein [Caldilineaceae bacterium]|nr:AbrB/MazE/SpoVT family DNA-binding domain-containing protein [Caldilineaceae bacterium]
MRVTTKGQVTIPLHIRERMQIAPASEVDFVVGEDDRVYNVKVSDGRMAKRFSDLRGITTVKMSTDEIMALTRAAK